MVAKYADRKFDLINNRWDSLNCTIDPSVRLVTEKRGTKDVIKWCNGYGDKWKLTYRGSMIGSEPTYGPNGTFGYGGFSRTGGRNVG